MHLSPAVKPVTSSSTKIYLVITGIGAEANNKNNQHQNK